MKKLSISLIILINILFISTNSIAFQEIKILYKIDNSIITNVDIDNELNYLISLNTNLKRINKNESIKIAKDSLIREKIKLNEIKKFFQISKYENKSYMDNLLKSIYTKLDLNNISEFENYLNDSGLTIENVKEKMKVEILWNQLIARKFKNQINVDENRIRQNVKNEKMNYREIIEYDLSEIVIAPKNEQDLNEKFSKIVETINSYGFETAANKFSISDTSKLGGNIGKVRENQISKIIRNEIKKLEVNEFSRPIYINNNYLIIKINKKEIINEKFDENKIVDGIVNAEKQKQFQNFSQIYFNKIKLNSQINEF